LGLLISAVLLIRFAIDFSEGMDWLLAVPFDALVIAALGIGSSNVWGQAKSESVIVDLGVRDLKRAFMLAAIPFGFLASSLDCTGLSLQGCSSFCTFVKLAWIPLIAGFCAIYFFKRVQGWLTALAVMSLVPLAPHCVCYNIGNAWWIDRIGRSPLCYNWGVVVSVIAIGALSRGSNFRLSLVLSFAIVAGAGAFFVSHHYFQIPW
jgi:hypothetical protein